MTTDRLISAINGLADEMRSKGIPKQRSYSFSPEPDMTLGEVIELLKVINIFTSSDDYLSEDFPSCLKRHFRPQS